MRLIQNLSKLLRNPARAGLPLIAQGRTGSLPRRHVLLQELPLAGFQHHRGEGVWPFLDLGAELELRREPYNPHDRYAIAVWFKNERLGYVPRKHNRLLAELMDRGERLGARVTRLLETDNPWRRVRICIELDV
jgi:hypothetical protein